MSLGVCLIPFSLRKAIGSYVLIYCTLIGATVRHYILLISSALGPEDTFTETVNAWLFVVKSGGLRGGYIFFKNLSLIMLPADTLKV